MRAMSSAIMSGRDQDMGGDATQVNDPLTQHLASVTDAKARAIKPAVAVSLRWRSSSSRTTNSSSHAEGVRMLKMLC